MFIWRKKSKTLYSGDVWVIIMLIVLSMMFGVVGLGGIVAVGFDLIENK